MNVRAAWPLSFMAALGLPVMAAAQDRAGRSVSVRVEEVAGGRAYLSAGEERGVQVGSVATLRGNRLRITAVSRNHSVVELGRVGAREGDRGLVTTATQDSSRVERRAAPRPLASYRGMWPPAVRPATTQPARRIPIAIAPERGAVRLAFSEVTAIGIPLAETERSVAASELRGSVDARLGPSTRLELDAALRLWLLRGLAQGADSDERPLVIARALNLGFSPSSALDFSLGRLRSAGPLVGTLDGARVTFQPLTGLSLSAFGGLDPEPVSTLPSLRSGRFGVEASLGSATSGLSPKLTVLGTGTTFEGRLDERRVLVWGELFPGPLRVTGSLEGGAFDANNAWRAAPLELTAARVDAGLTLRPLHLGLYVDYWRPERSRFLESFVPAGWLCQRAVYPEGCQAALEPTVTTGADARVDHSDGSVWASLRLGTDPGGTTLSEGSGLVAGRLTNLFGFLRVELALSVTRTAYLDLALARPGLGFALLEGRLDLTLYGRPALRRSFLDGVWQFDGRGGFELSATPVDSFDTGLVVEAGGGVDRPSLLVLSTASWRPSL